MTRASERSRGARGLGQWEQTMATLHALNTHAFTLRPAWAAIELGSAAASALVGARQAAALQAADAPLLSRLAAVSSLLFPARLPKTSATPCCKLPKAAPCCCAGRTGALLRVHLRAGRHLTAALTGSFMQTSRNVTINRLSLRLCSVLTSLVG